MSVAVYERLFLWRLCRMQPRGRAIIWVGFVGPGMRKSVVGSIVAGSQRQSKHSLRAAEATLKPTLAVNGYGSRIRIRIRKFTHLAVFRNVLEIHRQSEPHLLPGRVREICLLI
eukprot:scaffold261622_cov33-Attheya_sp.AAC.1